MNLDPNIDWSFHRAFGLVVASDRALAFCQIDGAESAPDLLIRAVPDLGPITGPCFHDVEDYPFGPVLRIYGDDEVIDVEYDHWRFSWRPGEGLIAYHRGPGEQKTHWSMVLERVVVPLYLLTSRSDVLALHGSAVELEGRAWIFIGDSGVGKSTTAYELISVGAHLLSDDMTLIALGARGSGPQVLSGCPSLRLWRQEGAIAQAREDLQIHEATPKRWFRLQDDYARSESTPLAGLIWLQPTLDLAMDGQVARPRGQAALASLLRQCFDYTDPPRSWMIQRFQRARDLFAASPFIAYHYKRCPDGKPAHIEGLRPILIEPSLEAAL